MEIFLADIILLFMLNTFSFFYKPIGSFTSLVAIKQILGS